MPNRFGNPEIKLVKTLERLTAGTACGLQWSQKMSSDDKWCPENTYQNRVVYVARTDQVESFDFNDFRIQSMSSESCGDNYVFDEVVIALGSGVSKKRALLALRRVIEVVEQGPEVRIRPRQDDFDFSKFFDFSASD